MTRQPWEVSSIAELLHLLPGGGRGLKLCRETTLCEGPASRPLAANAATQQATLAEGIRTFLEANPILPLLEGRVGVGRLRRVARTNGGEWAGPCPLCGGDDRLRVWPSPKEGSPRAWCRRCDASGDALNWATRFAGRNPSVRGSTLFTLEEHGLLPERILSEDPRRRDGMDSSFPRFLRRSPNEVTASMPADLREQYEERAAIMEYEGNLPREVAERRALAGFRGIDYWSQPR